jgi:predicted amidohydrolase
MSTTLKIACIQNCAGPEVAPNLPDCERLVRAAAADGAHLISLPEYFSGLDVGPGGRILAPAFAEDEHPALPWARALARDVRVHLNLGSLAIRAGSGGKAFNRGYMIGPDGAVMARYDKLFLFDVALAGGETYRESETIQGGREAVAVETPWGLVGLSICYDLRFGHLYRALAQAGARLLLVPAAFTKTTGEAHWHVLLRARAIETGSFVAAACQCGRHAGGAASYGHSLIVDPWGRVLADGGEEPGFVSAEIDLAEADSARAMIPAWSDTKAFPVKVARRLAAAS